MVNGEMHLNEAGEMARRCWQDIPDHFPLVELDVYVIMPNHVHGTIAITDAPQPCKGEKSFAPTTTFASVIPVNRIRAITRIGATHKNEWMEAGSKPASAAGKAAITPRP